MSGSSDSLEARVNELQTGQAMLDPPAPTDHLDIDDLIESASRMAQSDVASAQQTLDLCERLAPGRQRLDIIPQATYIRARMAVNRGDPNDALRLIDSARQGWMELDRPLDAFRTDLGRMHVLDDLGRHHEAVETGVRLLACLDELDCPEGSKDHSMAAWLRAAAQENLGAAYGYVGRHDEALGAYDRAESEYGTLGDTSDVARCRANRGVELVALGHALAGLDAITDAAEMFAQIGDDHSYAKCLGHRAEAELLLGHYNECLSRFAEARTLLEKLDARTEAARLAITTVRAYLSANLTDEAVDLGERTDHVVSELGLAHDQAEIRWLLGMAHSQIGQHEQALSRLDQAIVGAVASDDPPLRIRALTVRSMVLSAMDRGDEALDTARDALAIASLGSWPSDEWNLRLHLSRLVDKSEAPEHLAVARRLADDLGLPHLRYGVLLELGRWHRSQGELSQARQLFEQAVVVVEDLRGLIRDEVVRTSFLEGRTAAHSELMTVLLAEDDSPRDRVTAFEVAERSKARTLADMVAGGAVQRPDNDSTEPGTSRYQADLDACYRALITNGPEMTRDRRMAVQRRATELEILVQRRRLEHEQLKSTLLGESANGPPVAHPAPEDQVVEYHIAGDTLVAFVWSDGDLEVVTEFPTVTEIRRLVDAWIRQRERFLLATRLPGDAAASLASSANRALEEVWARIFAPVSTHLTERSELLIVPHGALHAVPFHALPTPDGRVGEQWTVLLAPSFAVARALQRRTARAEKSLVIGVADEAAPAVEGEAQRVARALPNAELLLNDQATKQRVQAAVREPRDVIHFACHGLHRSRNPMFSALKLADGWLTAYDVMTMNLSDSLIVLSACETGRHEGDHVLSEPVGLARSFLAVGARAAVVSLWRAHDDVTADLMSHFYHHAGSGTSPSAALQQAQSKVLHHHPHPAAWAPFAVHGGLSAKGEQ